MSILTRVQLKAKQHIRLTGENLNKETEMKSMAAKDEKKNAAENEKQNSTSSENKNENAAIWVDASVKDGNVQDSGELSRAGQDQDKADTQKKESEQEKKSKDAKKGNDKKLFAYLFEFKFVDGHKEVEKKFYAGKGTEAEAIAQARKLADEFSAGRFTVVFTGNFKKLE